MNNNPLPQWQLGQKVICVDDAFPRAIWDWCEYLPRAGCGYTIRAMQLGYDGVTRLPSLGFLFEEFVNPPSSLGYEAGFDQTRFAIWLATDSEADHDANQILQPVSQRTGAELWPRRNHLAGFDLKPCKYENIIRTRPMNKYSDVPKSDFAGYPKTLYDDGDTKLEIWKFKGAFAEFNQLILMIPNKLFSSGESGAVKVKMKGVNCICLNPPRKMNPRLKTALQDERFEMKMDDDILPTDEYLIVRLGNSLAYDLERLFDMNGVGYNKELLIQYIKDLGVEAEIYKNAVIAMNATRSTRTLKVPDPANP